MGKAELIEPALPHAYGSASKPSIAAGNVTKSDFSCWFKGYRTDTLEAVEAYLVYQGIPRQAKVAELIMIFEIYFAGKYRKGERYHYQHICPTSKCGKGNSLSEKLTRCKDKETFNGRFSRVGTTDTLRREHFKNHEIVSLNFEGKMYLRLIDTTRDNISYFFRNDAVADALIKSAIAFYRQEVKAKKYKTRRALVGIPEVVETGKPEVVFLENPKPLLYTEVDSRRPSGKNKGNSLTLVYSSPNGRNQNQPQPRKGRLKKETSGFGDAEQQIAEECGLITASITHSLSVCGFHSSTSGIASPS